MSGADNVNPGGDAVTVVEEIIWPALISEKFLKLKDTGMTFELHYASITSCLARPEVNDWINKTISPVALRETEYTTDRTARMMRHFSTDLHDDPAPTLTSSSASARPR
jgi:hypothetical protein